ncbi:MAG TPA: universal stress protein [Acidimicrobiales bacterium]|nr:universal stress protein [Acidimicrobiales bacterium]
MAYRRVIVGTDGSETAAGAVRSAAQLAAAVGAAVTVVTAYEEHERANATARAEAPDEVRWAISDATGASERANAARRLAVEAGVRDVDVFVEPGDPASVVISAAEARGGDLIVVGSKGMTSAKRFLLGSVPNKISHHAPCDVMIVHTAP